MKEERKREHVKLEKQNMNTKVFTTTAFCCEGKKNLQHLGLNVFNYSGLEHTVKLNPIKWKTGFMTAEMSEREKSQAEVHRIWQSNHS